MKQSRRPRKNIPLIATVGVLTGVVASLPVGAFASVADDERLQLQQERQRLLIEHENLVHAQLLREHEDLMKQLARRAPPPAPAAPAQIALATPAAMSPVAAPAAQEAPPELPAAIPQAPGSPQKSRAPLGLGTVPGWELGGDVSKYSYHEKVNEAPFMKTHGYKFGGEGAYTTSLDNQRDYLRGELRVAYGHVSYYGSGEINGVEDYLGEARALVGRDLILQGSPVSFTPYTGYGARYLYYDGRGLSTDNHHGYRRESFYQYIPLGLTNRIGINEDARIATTVEYDYFVRGHQVTYLGDVNPLISTLNNEQHRGVNNTKASVLFETGPWSMGPWFNYWHIPDSRVACVPGFCGMEPDNKTVEFGLKLVKRFD